MTTRQRFLAGMIGGTLAAAVILGVTIKDLGLIHGTTTPGAIYCAELVDRYGDTAIGGGTTGCVEMFDGLDEDDQRLLLEDLGK